MAKTKTVNDTKSMLSNEIKYIFQAADNHIFTSKLHSHTFYEFIYILKGVCTHFCDGNTYEMQSGDFILLSPGNQHCFLSQSKSISLLCISIAKDEFQKYKLLYGDSLTTGNTKPMKLKTPVAKILIELVSDIHNPTQNEIRAVCSCLFANYCDVIGENGAICPRLTFMTEELLKSTDNLQSGIKAMTRLSSYSEAQLGRLTKKYYNTSPHEYLKHLRLQKAWQYILQTDLSLEEISFLCGYNCYGYFTNIFKDKYGLSPAMLRKTKH